MKVVEASFKRYMEQDPTPTPTEEENNPLKIKIEGSWVRAVYERRSSKYPMKFKSGKFHQTLSSSVNQQPHFISFLFLFFLCSSIPSRFQLV